MVNRVLENGVSVKDENRLANATAKLTSLGHGDKFTYNTDINISAIGGIEENPTVSQVDLISCIRDQNGNNRLCTNIRGVATPNKDQTSSYAFYGFDVSNPISMNTSESSLPKNKILYITGVVFTNGGGQSNFYSLTINGQNVFSVYIPSKQSLVIPNLNIPVVTGDDVEFLQVGGVSTADNVNVLYIIQ